MLGLAIVAACRRPVPSLIMTGDASAERYLRALIAANPGSAVLLGELVLARNRAGDHAGAARRLIAAASGRLESHLLEADVQAAAGSPPGCPVQHR